jgi:beta-N-acetylhexosaminidase
MKKNIGIILLLVIILAVGCKKDNINIGDKDIKPEELPSEDNNIQIDPIEDRIKSMSLEEKIGQLLIVGFEGTEINQEIISFIEKLKVGGFILFSRNIEDENKTLKLLNNIKEANSDNDIPLFLSIDEEGGRVSRLPKAFKRLPESIKLGNKNDKEISYNYGKILGERVKALGFNVDFAPVLDINSNPKNPVIGNRAFGSTVDIVVSNGIQVMSGIRDTNIIPAVKHFPGHGDTGIDSHVNLPIVKKSMEELEKMELIPFIKAIEEDVDMIMVAHILYPAMDEEYPSTMSQKIIQNLLRDQLGYNGVIVSDDMTMGAIVENYSLEEASLRFIKSGGDIALICHGNDNPKKVIEHIKESVNTGNLSEIDIDKKVYRILKLKEKYDLEDKIIESNNLEELNTKTIKLIEEINK